MQNMDMHTRFPSPPGAQRGAAAIEFAFILPLLLVIFTGTVEFGRAMWHYDALAKAARDAARYLSTVPTADLGSEADSATSITRSIVTNVATRASVAGLTPATDITITCAPTACGSALSPADVTTVSVDINYPFVIGGWIPVFGPSPADAPSVVTTALAPHVTMRYMR
jgi:Flp pilus assembly protein TadG